MIIDGKDKGKWVVHPKCPEWGPGKIVNVLRGMAFVKFKNMKEIKAKEFKCDSNPLELSLLESDPALGEITTEYREIRSLLESGCPVVFVNGAAGTGKSTFIRYLESILKKRLVVVAPTGVAALNVKGATIHSFFQFPPRVITSASIKKVQDSDLYKKLELLIVDEISMVRADQIDGIDAFLRLNGRDSKKPFGGVQVLMIGDLFQLPPVVTPDEIIPLKKYESPYFFSATVFKEIPIKLRELSKIFRQRDPNFTEILNKIRVAENLDNVLAQLNSACFTGNDNREVMMILTLTNSRAEQINYEKLKKLPKESIVFEGETLGSFSSKSLNLPAPLKLEIKPGARVIFTKNDEQKRWVNGTVGNVKEVTKKTIHVELLTDHSGEVYEVPKAAWENFRYEYDKDKEIFKHKSTGTYTQYPLKLAWAVTIHKSQGQTLQNIKLDLGKDAWEFGQIYVALSRCRALNDIVLTRPLEVREVKCDERVKKFFSNQTK